MLVDGTLATNRVDVHRGVDALLEDARSWSG
jgi:hypothetical protein